MIVAVRQVSKRFEQHWAVLRLELEVKEPATILLTGHNGAGKTTFLRMLATLSRPTYGSIEWFGKDRRELQTIRSKIHMIAHDTMHYDDLTASENLHFFATCCGGDTTKIPHILERFELTLAAHQYVRMFSAGMKRRLALARLLLKPCELVLFDEPFTQLDAQGMAVVENLMRDLQHQGTTLFIASHDIERVRPLATQHLILQHGQATAA